MPEQQPSHLLTVRIQNWTREEYIEPGRISPRDEQTTYYQGEVADCDRIADANGVLTLIDEIPATEERPFHSRIYLEPNANDPGLTELWCMAQPIETVTPWVQSLPNAGDVFSAVPCPPDPREDGSSINDKRDASVEFAQTTFDAAGMTKE